MIKKWYKSIFSEAFRNQVRRVFRKATSPYYWGVTYSCNCCGGNFRKMLSKAGRPNAECPNCGSLERTRLLLHYLKEETSIFSERLRVLHFAPEPPLFRILKDLKLDYIDADIHPDYARHKVDITQIPFDDESFDLIICSHVLAHVPNEQKAIREIKRVLSKTGVAIVMTYINPDSMETIDYEWINTPALRKEHYGEPDCLRLHGGDFKSRLEKEGLKVNQRSYLNEIDAQLRQKNVLGQGPREWIFECTR